MKRPAPNPKVMVRPAGFKPSVDPPSEASTETSSPIGRAGWPAVMRAAASVQALSIAITSSRDLAVRSKTAK